MTTRRSVLPTRRWQQFIPMVATGELTSAEALQAAHDLYIEEATAQGFIG